MRYIWPHTSTSFYWVADCSVFAQATVSDVTRASDSKIIIIDCETLACMEITQEVIRAREEDEKYNGRESDYDHIRLSQQSDTILSAHVWQRVTMTI